MKLILMAGAEAQSRVYWFYIAGYLRTGSDPKTKAVKLSYVEAMYLVIM